LSLTKRSSSLGNSRKERVRVFIRWTANPPIRRQPPVAGSGEDGLAEAAEEGRHASQPPADMFWGDRYGMVSDPFGHQWSFATHLKDLTPEQVREGMNEAFAQP
jgi:hypothetical protein